MTETSSIKSEAFNGQVKVAARIIDWLSSGLYPTPAACLKEIISNAYDADATLVQVFVKPEYGQIVISDNGNGFTKEAFQEHFNNVSESRKREDSEITEMGRKKIGKIGIGFIAANELCEEIEIFSTCKGSKDIMHVNMNFLEMSKSSIERKSNGGKYTKADYDGTITDDVDESEHYTQIYLKKIKGAAKNILTSVNQAIIEAENKIKSNLSLYGLKESTIRSMLMNPKLKMWEDFDFYSMTMLEIAMNVPVQYHENWHPKLNDNTRLSAINKDVEKNNFRVLYDGSELKKPIVLRNDRNYISETFEFKGELVSAKGYFFATHGTLYPKDTQGILIRIRGSAVGTYRNNFLGFSQSEKTLFQRWTTCEIYASDELENAMNIDRVTFRETHPVYIELRKEIFKQLRCFLNQVKDELYIENRDIKRETLKLEELKKITRTVKENIHQFSPNVAQEITKIWHSKDITQRQILRTYTSDEVLRITSEAAINVLPKPLYEKLMIELNKKLINDRTL